MKHSQYKRTASTRDRLLHAACRIFAERGYRDTTVAEICDAAQANIAAVNYHFGNKDSLYQQVWAHVLDIHVPLDVDPDSIATREGAERQLSEYIMDRLEWLMRGDRLERLIRAEVVQPTGLVDEEREAGLRKTRRHFLEVIRRIGEGALDEDDVDLCCTSILSQCRAFTAFARLGQGKPGDYRLESDAVQAFARHVTVFSVAGIRALAAEARSGATAKETVASDA